MQIAALTLPELYLAGAATQLATEAAAQQGHLPASCQPSECRKGVRRRGAAAAGAVQGAGADAARAVHGAEPHPEARRRPAGRRRRRMQGREHGPGR